VEGAAFDGRFVDGQYTPLPGGPGGAGGADPALPGTLVHTFCDAPHGMSCHNLCWASDASQHEEEQWVQIDFGMPRYVDMIHLWPFNAARPGTQGAEAAEVAVTSLEVQAPDGSGGWVRVGGVDRLPLPSLDAREAGVHLRPEGVPLYLVPPQYRGGVQRAARWLGFSASAIRLAALTPLRRGGGVGLCEVRVFEEQATVALQLTGAAAVRRGMLQLTPGDAFVREAARAHLHGGGLHVPPTVGEAAMDAAMRQMPRRLVRAAEAVEARLHRARVDAGLTSAQPPTPQPQPAAPIANTSGSADRVHAPQLVETEATLAAAALAAAAVACGEAVDQPRCPRVNMSEGPPPLPPPPQVLLEGIFQAEGVVVVEATVQRGSQRNAAGAPGRRLIAGHGAVYREEAYWAEEEEGEDIPRRQLHVSGMEPPYEQPQNLRNGEVRAAAAAASPVPSPVPSPWLLALVARPRPHRWLHLSRWDTTARTMAMGCCIVARGGDAARQWARGHSGPPAWPRRCYG
jgi:hypothetical protein